MRDSTLQARPQRTVDTVVPSTPSTYRFRCPRRLTSQPMAGMGMTRATRYPVMIHWTVCTSVPKAVMMLGRATTTPNMPKAIVNCPGKIAVATHHLSFELPLRAGLLVYVSRLAGEALTLFQSLMVPSPCNHQGLWLSLPLTFCKARTSLFSVCRMQLVQHCKIMINGICAAQGKYLGSPALSD